MAEVRECITALELNDRHMTCIEQHLGLLHPPDIPANNQTLNMLIDLPANTDLISTQVSSRPAALTVQEPLNPLLPSLVPTRPVRAPSLHPQLLLSLTVPQHFLPLTCSLS
ncbi:hypothetical protein RclHR1_08240016 [Rhizophagus clarus]|nr:hypothetical protein RclHR1_08240016 [Rhizophagus clarus]